MASINLFIRGHENLKHKYKSITQRLPSATASELQDIGKLLKDYATKKIKTITGSKQETRYNPRRVVTVSNPKAYPNHDTGRLVKGLKSVVSRNGKNIGLKFSSRAPYALDLEYGTRHMAARPYMKRTLDANKKIIRSMLARGVRSAL